MIVYTLYVCMYVPLKIEASINWYFAEKRSQQVVLDCLVKGTELLGIPFLKIFLL